MAAFDICWDVFGVDRSKPRFETRFFLNGLSLYARGGQGGQYDLTMSYRIGQTEDLDGVMEILKLREIYRHLSNAADRGDAAANVIGDIVVKWM